MREKLLSTPPEAPLGDEVQGSRAPGCCLTWTAPHGTVRTPCRSEKEKRTTFFAVMLWFCSHQASHGLKIKIISSAVLSPRLWSRKLCQKAARWPVLGYVGQCRSWTHVQPPMEQCTILKSPSTHGV